MQSYLATQLVEAEPMTRGAYNDLKGWTLPKKENSEDEGYLVCHSDGYTTWTPKHIFEKHNLPISKPDKITEEEVTSMIRDSKVINVGNKTTIVAYELLNGWVAVESSSCVDPANYDEELAVGICLSKVKIKLWENLGFLLQCSKNGFIKEVK